MEVLHTIGNLMINFPAVLAAVNVQESATAAGTAVNPGNALIAAGVAVIAGVIIYIKRHTES